MEGVPVGGLGLGVTLARSTYGFSGGTRGTAYWATAQKDMSHCFGVQTLRGRAKQRPEVWRCNECRSEQVSGVRLRREALTDHTSPVRACMQVREVNGEASKGRVREGEAGVNWRSSRLLLAAVASGVGMGRSGMSMWRVHRQNLFSGTVSVAPVDASGADRTDVRDGL